MKQKVVLFGCAALAATTTATAAAGAEEDLPPLEGYTVVPMTWRGVNETDGTEIVLSGTIQEIYKQLQDISPSSKWRKSAESTNYTDAAENKSGINCAVGGDGVADLEYIQEGIDYLKGITGGPCGAGAGPRVCSRISCSWDSGIWLCNDTPTELHQDCAWLATYAEDIRDSCHGGDGTYVWVRGQEFDTQDFNVIVGRTRC